MANAGQSTKTIAIKLEVLPSEAIQTIKSAQTALEKLQTQQKVLELQGKRNTEEYIANAAEIKNLNQVISQNQRVLQDSINSQKQNADSLNALRAQLASLLKQYDDLTKAERESSKGTDMLQHIKDLTDEIKSIEEETKRFQRSVGSYKDSIQAAINGTTPMKTALREIRAELTQLTVQYRESEGLIQGQQQVLDQLAQTEGKESQAYKDAATELDNLIQKRGEMKSQIDDMTQQAGQLDDAIRDVGESIKNAGADYAPLVAAKQSADLLLNTYTALHGTLVALGIEDENLIEIYAKLQIVQKGLNALTQIYNLLQKQSVLRQQLNVLWTNLTTKSLGSLILAKKKDAVASVEATAATSAFAAGEAVATTTSFTLVGALKAVSAAIMSIPIIGWILAAIAGLGTLIGLVIRANKEEDLGKSIANEILASDQQRLNTLQEISRQEQQIAEHIKEQADALASLDKNSRAYKDNVKDIADYLGVSEEYVKKHPEELEKAIENQEKLNELTKQTEENEKTINESIKNREELYNDVNAAINSGYEMSKKQLQKMVDDGRITEDQMKIISKIRKQLVKGEIDSKTANNAIKILLKEQVNAYNAIVSKSQTQNNNLKQQIKLQKQLVDDVQTKSDKETKSGGSNDAKERHRNEINEIRKTQDLELQMVKEGLEKQLAEYRLNLNRQIEDLKERLKTEKNLTKRAKEEINKQITLLSAKQVDDEMKIRKKYNDDYIKQQLSLWKTYYKSIQDSVPKGSDQSLQARLQVLKMAYDETVKSVQNSRKAIDELYADFEQKSLLTGKERQDMLKQLGMTEDEFQRRHTEIINQWDETNRIVPETLANMEKAYRAEVVKMNKQFVDDEKQLQQEIVDISLENFDQRRLNEIETSNFIDKEVRKTQVLEEQARKRLEIAKKEASDITSLTQEQINAIYGSDEQYQLAIQQALLNVTKAEGEYAKAMQNSADALKAQKQLTVETGISIAQAMSDAAGSLSNLFNTLAEDNEKYSDFATGMAMAQILISSAIAVAQAIQAAVQAGGFSGPAAPVTIPIFIAEMVGIVASGIASAVSTLNQAKKAKTSAPKFATGGLITEGNDTTGKKDNVHIMVSKGEYVVKKKAVDAVGVDFLDKLNNIDGKTMSRSGYYAAGGQVTTGINTALEAISYDKMKTMFSEALQDMPSPVVSVKEITNKQNRVKVKEQFSMA